MDGHCGSRSAASKRSTEPAPREGRRARSSRLTPRARGSSTSIAAARRQLDIDVTRLPLGGGRRGGAAHDQLRRDLPRLLARQETSDPLHSRRNRRRRHALRRADRSQRARHPAHRLPRRRAGVPVQGIAEHAGARRRHPGRAARASSPRRRLAGATDRAARLQRGDALGRRRRARAAPPRRLPPDRRRSRPACARIAAPAAGSRAAKRRARDIVRMRRRLGERQHRRHAGVGVGENLLPFVAASRGEGGLEPGGDRRPVRAAPSGPATRSAAMPSPRSSAA